MSDYIKELTDKLDAARKRVRQGAEVKQLKASAPTLFEIMDGEISLAVNKAFAEKPLPYEEYLSVHGRVIGTRRVRDLLNSKETEEVVAAQEVQALESQLKQFDDDKKAQAK